MPLSALSPTPRREPWVSSGAEACCSVDGVGSERLLWDGSEECTLTTHRGLLPRLLGARTASSQTHPKAHSDMRQPIRRAGTCTASLGQNSFISLGLLI